MAPHQRKPASKGVWVDEAGTNIALTLHFARSPRGKRAVGSVPKNRGESITLVAGLTPSGLVADMMLPGAMDGIAFETWVEQVLVPELHAGQTVYVDNLGAHKPERVRELIEGAGCGLVFLPGYWPDLNPMEAGLSKL